MSKAPARDDQPRSPDRFRGTRAAHRDETGEDYVEAIAELAARIQEVRVKNLAAMMGVSHVTVSRILKRLVGEGLVLTEPYRPVTLTPKGQRLAQRAAERHETVLRFLVAIGVPDAQAQIDAEGIEHHVSAQTIAAMQRYTRQPGTAKGDRPPTP
ncbi:MAG: manganese-binding transcriptional regulator MntR [Phycisphaerales bacterium]|nr:manganese-binding transcriptional regulator MntR [Phycisphaerales bacterium]